jgi:hypothetical protein
MFKKFKSFFAVNLNNLKSFSTKLLEILSFKTKVESKPFINSPIDIPTASLSDNEQALLALKSDFNSLLDVVRAHEMRNVTQEHLHDLICEYMENFAVSQENYVSEFHLFLQKEKDYLLNLDIFSRNLKDLALKLEIFKKENQELTLENQTLVKDNKNKENFIKQKELEIKSKNMTIEILNSKLQYTEIEVRNLKALKN